MPFMGVQLDGDCFGCRDFPFGEKGLQMNSARDFHTENGAGKYFDFSNNQHFYRSQYDAVSHMNFRGDGLSHITHCLFCNLCEDLKINKEGIKGAAESMAGKGQW